LPFPVTEIFADAEFLIGGNRPEQDLPEQKKGDPKAAM
jgi:hypothetical protein